MIPNTKYKIQIGTRAYSMTEVRADVYAIRDSTDVLLGEIIKIPAHGRAKERWLLSGTRDEFASHTYAIPALEAAYWRAAAGGDPAPAPAPAVALPVVTVPVTPPAAPIPAIPDGWATARDIAAILNVAPNSLTFHANAGRVTRRKLEHPAFARGSRWIYQIPPQPAPITKPAPAVAEAPPAPAPACPPTPLVPEGWATARDAAAMLGIDDPATLAVWALRGKVTRRKLEHPVAHGARWIYQISTIPALSAPQAPLDCVPAPVAPPVVTRRAPNYADVLAELATLRAQVAALQAPKPSLWQRLTGGAL